MSYSHANSAPYFHHAGMMQQQQQLQQHQPQQQQQRTQYSQQQMQQSQPSYDGQSYNIGYHHGAGSGSSIGLQQQQQQQHNGAQQSLSFLGDSQSPPQHQQQGMGTGAGQYSSYVPSSNGYHASSASQHPSFEDHQYHHHPHYAQQQQQHAALHHQHHQHQQQLGSFESASSSSGGDYPSHAGQHHQHHHASGLAGPSSAGSPLGGDRNAQLPTSGMRPKRRQVKNACVNCQKACKKCDEGRPCSRCIKYGLTDTCEDSLRKERKRGIKRGPYKRRTTTGGTTGAIPASAMGASNSNSGSSSSGSLMYGGNGFDGHYHHPGGHDYRSNHSAGIGPSLSSSGSLFQRDQSRSAISPDVKAGGGWPSLTPSSAVDVKGSWPGLGPSSSTASASTSSADAHSSRLPMLNLQQAQQHGGGYGLDGGAGQDHRYSSGITSSAASSNVGGRMGLSPSPMYGSHSLASSSSPSAGQQFRPLPTSSSISHHQRYQSESSGQYNSSSGSSATASTANFSSPRTPLSADVPVNSLAPGAITSPPLSMGFMKSPGIHGHHPLAAASYVHNAPQNQQQSSTGSTPRQFALQMPPMPKGRGGGAAEMFNAVPAMSMRGTGGHFRADSAQDDGVVGAGGALTTAPA